MQLTLMDVWYETYVSALAESDTYLTSNSVSTFKFTTIPPGAM